MIPTAEVPLVNYYRGDIMDAAKLPVNFTALTPAFRSEAGSAGRILWINPDASINKVEMVKFCKPEDSWKELKNLIHDAEDLLRKLGLPYHVITLASNDASFTSAKQTILKCGSRHRIAIVKFRVAVIARISRHVEHKSVIAMMMATCNLFIHSTAQALQWTDRRCHS